MDAHKEETFELCQKDEIGVFHYYGTFSTLTYWKTYTVVATLIDENSRSIKVFEKGELFCEFDIIQDDYYLTWSCHGKYEGWVSHCSEWHVMFYNHGRLHDDGSFFAKTLYDKKDGNIVHQAHYKKGYRVKDSLVKCCRKA